MSAPFLTVDLNAPLRVLHGEHRPLLVPEGAVLVPGLNLWVDPEARGALHLASPRGRLLEIDSRVSRPGAWMGLHVSLALPDLDGATWVGFALRSAAGAAMACRACLRSGHEGGGFHDQFFDRQILSRPWQADHHDLLAPAHCPGLPLHAVWREFVLFLPPAQDFRLSLHDLRVFVL